MDILSFLLVAFGAKLFSNLNNFDLVSSVMEISIYF